MREHIVPYRPGVVEVHAGSPGVLLTVRRSPLDVVNLISVEMSRDDARTVAEALLGAATVDKAVADGVSFTFGPKAQP